MSLPRRHSRLPDSYRAHLRRYTVRVRDFTFCRVRRDDLAILSRAVDRARQLPPRPRRVRDSPSSALARISSHGQLDAQVSPSRLEIAENEWERERRADGDK